MSRKTHHPSFFVAQKPDHHGDPQRHSDQISAEHSFPSPSPLSLDLPMAGGREETATSSLGCLAQPVCGPLGSTHKDKPGNRHKLWNQLTRGSRWLRQSGCIAPRGTHPCFGRGPRAKRRGVGTFPKLVNTRVTSPSEDALVWGSAPHACETDPALIPQGSVAGAYVACVHGN